jgi:serine phosphatase RsbU (regulator of sigma subunit)
MVAGFISLDRAWTVSYLNREAERILDVRRDDLLGRNIWTAFPGAEELEFGRQYHRAVQTGETVLFEAFYPNLGKWFEIRAVPTADGIDVYFLDATTRREAQERAEQAMQRAQLLSDISRDLASTLDGREAVTRLASLLVPTLADWCVISVADDHGEVANLGFAHRDPDRLPLVASYAGVHLSGVSDQSTIWQVLRTGEPMASPTITPERLDEVFVDPEVRQLLTQLDPTSGLAVPLTARGETLGVLSLWNTDGRAAHSEAEVALAVDIGLRAGLALDNARLFARQSRFSEALQRSLLTEPPEPDHCEIVVRYLSAAHETQVGGDWYDAFMTAGGATVLAIGDVVGHDTTAAAAMGQVRGLLRGIGFTTGGGPAEVLGRLDVAMEGLMLDTMATAVVARMEQDADDLAHGVLQLRWSSAGHLPIMVIDDEHQVTWLASEPDLMLGVDPETPRSETVTTLRRGSTILLYTDGLIERRGAHLDKGLRLLAECLASLAGLPLPELVDELLACMVTADNEDDVALIAVRLHPQDAPRPAEAGPTVLPEPLAEGESPAGAA